MALVVFAAATFTVKVTISLFLPLIGAITWICDVCVPADGYSIVGGLPDVRPMSSPSSPLALNRSGRVVQLAVEPVLILTW